MAKVTSAHLGLVRLGLPLPFSTPPGALPCIWPPFLDLPCIQPSPTMPRWLLPHLRDPWGLAAGSYVALLAASRSWPPPNEWVSTGAGGCRWKVKCHILRKCQDTILWDALLHKSIGNLWDWHKSTTVLFCCSFHFNRFSAQQLHRGLCHSVLIQCNISCYWGVYEQPTVIGMVYFEAVIHC